MSQTEQKDILRQEALRHRTLMDPGSEDPEHAVPHFFDALDIGKDQVLAAYWPKDKEFDARYIMDEAQRRNIQCALPIVVKDDRVLNFAPWDEGVELVKGAFDIYEPVHEKSDLILPDVVLVPLLAFDRRGGRLGYGGGYYDATLKYLRSQKPIIAVGVAYAQQACLFNLPREDHDELLDLVITPKGVHDFRA